MSRDADKVCVDILQLEGMKPIVEWKRFAILCVGSFGLISCSFGYAYNLISADLQALLDLSQRDLTAISTCGYVFNYCSLPYAFIFDYFGPVPVAVLAVLYYSTGALLMALTTAGTIQGSTVRLCVFNAINNHGMMLYDMAGCVTVLSHFPTLRGFTVAMLKTYVGLGSSIVGAIQLAFFADRVDHFFYFLMSYATVVGGLIVCFTRLPPYHLTGYERRRLGPEEAAAREATKAVYLRQQPPIGRFVYGYTIIFILIAFLPIQSCLIAYKGLGQGYKVGFAITIIIITLSNVFIFFPNPFRWIGTRLEKKKKLREETYLVNDSKEEKEAEVAEELKSPQLGEIPEESLEETTETDAGAQRSNTIETEVDYIAPQYQTPFLRSLLTLRLWCIVWTLFCLGGAENVIIVNASYIYGAIDGKPVEPTLRVLLTSLNGVGSAVGRLLMATFEHLSQHRPAEQRVPITWAPFIPVTLMIICLVLFLTLPARALPLPYVLCALANGAQAAQTLLVARTIYAKDPAKHYNFCFVAIVVSSMIYLPFLYGEWYYRQSLRTGGSKGYCWGRECIVTPFCIMLGLVVSAGVTSLFVTVKYTRFCRRAFAERRRLREEAAANTIYTNLNTNQTTLVTTPLSDPSAALASAKETVVGAVDVELLSKESMNNNDNEKESDNCVTGVELNEE